MGTYAPVICVSRLICRAGNERKLLTDFACVHVCECVYNLAPLRGCLPPSVLVLKFRSRVDRTLIEKQ